MARFSDLLLELFGDKMNMMLTEALQLPPDVIKNKNELEYSELVREILIEIGAGNIKSSHFTKKEAQNAIAVWNSVRPTYNLSDDDETLIPINGVPENEYENLTNI